MIARGRFALLAFLYITLSATGCQTMRQPTSQTHVDQAITATMRPSLPPPTVHPDEARPGFQQEPPKSQTP